MVSIVAWAIGLLSLILYHLPTLPLPRRQKRYLHRQFHSIRGKSESPDASMASSGVGFELPDEMLIAIVSCLDLDTLYNLRLTSRHLRELAEPLIFEEFAILHGSDALHLATCIRTDRRRAKWVKSLLVSTRYGEDDGLSILPFYLAEMRNMRDLRLETPDCNTKKPDDRVDWVKLQRGYEAILAKSTVAVPHHERLLPNLQTCTIHFVDETKALYPLTQYSSIFLHPTLKSLTLSCACTGLPSELLVPYQKQYRRSTNLEHLHLEECDIYTASLYILLCFPRALKSLSISEGTRYDEGFGPQQSRMHGNALPHFLANAITQSSRNSLERLSLDLGYKRGLRNINTEGRFLDLTNLDKVTYLELSSETAANMVITRPVCDHQTFRRLPPNLKTFKIFDLNPYGFPPFRRGPNIPAQDCLIKDKVSHGIPKLDHVIWSYHYQTVQGGQLEGFVRRLAGEDAARSQQLKATKIYLTEACNKSLSLYRASGVRMQIEFVEAPNDFIPPYLYPEPKPTSSIFWDSESPPVDAATSPSRNLDRNGRQRNDPMVIDSSDSADSDFDSDSDLGSDLAMTGLPPQAQAFMSLLMNNNAPH